MEENLNSQVQLTSNEKPLLGGSNSYQLSRSNSRLQFKSISRSQSIASRHAVIKRKFTISSSRGFGSRHDFKSHFFMKPTWCDFCKQFIDGVASKQGMYCKNCSYACHFKPCLEIAQNCECTESVQKLERRREKEKLDIKDGRKNKIKDFDDAILANLQNELLNEDICIALYNVIDDTIGFDELTQKSYLHLDFGLQFAKPEIYSAKFGLMQLAVKKGHVRKDENDVKRFNILVDILNSLERFNRNLFHTLNIWVLNHANFAIGKDEGKR